MPKFELKTRETKCLREINVRELAYTFKVCACHTGIPVICALHLSTLKPSFMKYDPPMLPSLSISVITSRSVLF